MLKTISTLLIAALLLFTSPASVLAATSHPHVLLKTSSGDIELELDPQQAPVSVANFIGYVNSGFYNNTIFHRVIADFMIQGGGFNADMQPKTTGKPIKNEADNGPGNQRGTIAMARTSEKDSATSQFFINVADNDFLNHGARDFGYAVFGKVVNGMAVVDEIVRQPSKRVGPHQDVPQTPVLILSATLIPATTP